jgi:hypothetical protein
MTAACEINNCGVAAIGRCAICGNAFCATHQGRIMDWPLRTRVRTLLIDKCSSCQTAEEERQTAEDYATGGLFFHSGAAATMLTAANVPTVELHTVSYAYETKRFGRVQSTATATPYGRGWLLGTFRWTHHDGGNYGGSDVAADRLTVLLDARTPDSVVYAVSRLVCVNADAERSGYVVVTNRGRFTSGEYAFPTIATRVRELAGQG